MSDYRDLALEMLADEEAQARRDVVVYRMMALAALDRLHELTVAHQALKEERWRLVLELRRLRGSLPTGKAASAA